jgi:hypothetical protein
MRRLALVALMACGSHHEEAEYPPRQEQHDCDRKGAKIAQYTEQPDLQRELSPEEIALQGTCTRTSHPTEWHIDRIIETVENESMTTADCSGACQPMRAALPALDRTHDLEDETLQRDCTAAATKLEAKIRAGCSHVCLVLRREQASKAIFVRVMRGLWAFNRKLEKKKLGDAEVRHLWDVAGVSLPPRRFVLGTTDEPAMTASGAYYLGGPSLRLKLSEQEAGCGDTAWGVNTWW